MFVNGVAAAIGPGDTWSLPLEDALGPYAQNTAVLPLHVVLRKNGQPVAVDRITVYDTAAYHVVQRDPASRSRGAPWRALRNEASSRLPK